MAHCQDGDEVVAFKIVVKRDVAGASLRDHQFAQSTFRRPANERMALKHRDGIEDQVDGVERDGGIFRRKKLFNLR